MEDPEMLLAAVLAWAMSQQHILAIIETGSRGRGTRVDAFSDLDLEIITPEWRRLYDDGSWLTAIGDVLLNVSFDQEDNLRSNELGIRLVMYRGGCKIDFTLTSARRIHNQAMTLTNLYDRGYRVVFDRTGIIATLPTPTGVTFQPLAAFRIRSPRP